MSRYAFYTEIEKLDRATLAATRAILGVDQNGKPIEKAEPKKAAPPVSEVKAVTPTPPAKKVPNRKELVAHGLYSEDSDTGHWTPLGVAWKAAGRFDVETLDPQKTAHDN